MEGYMNADTNPTVTQEHPPEGEYIENDAFTLMNVMTNTATLYYPDWT